jgi:hypothetical protein
MKSFIFIGLLVVAGIFISIDYEERVDENICPKNSETIDEYRTKRVEKLQEAKAIFKLWEEQLNSASGTSRDKLMDEYRNKHVVLMDDAIDFGILENFTLHLQEQCYTQESIIDGDEYLETLKIRTSERIIDMNLLTSIPFQYPIDIFAKLGEDINLP